MLQKTPEKTIPVAHETEAGSPETWEAAVDSWVEEKIQRELEKIVRQKYQGNNPAVVANMKKDWENRVAVEDKLKVKLKKILPRVFSQFATHGSPATNKDGQRIIAAHPDLDGKTCLGLMKLAGWQLKKEKTFYTDFSEHKKATVHLDVGQHDGVALLKEIDGQLETIDLLDQEKITKLNKGTFWQRLGLIIDHHPESLEPSAASMVFRLLDKLGLLNGQETIKPGEKIKLIKMIKFVDLVDSYGFQALGDPNHFFKSDRTILGLNRFMTFENLWKFFKNTDGDYLRQLSDEELRRYGFIYTDNKGKVVNNQEKQRKIIDSSLKKLEELTADGYIIETKFGKIVIDVDSKLAGGATAAQTIDAGYLKWDSVNNTLYLFANQELDPGLFDYGTRVRKLSWVMPAGLGRTSCDLKGVIARLGGKVISGSQLEDYLNK